MSRKVLARLAAYGLAGGLTTVLLLTSCAAEQGSQQPLVLDASSGSSNDRGIAAHAGFVRLRESMMQVGVSPGAADLAARVVLHENSAQRPFIVIDKVQAHLYVMQANGQLLGHAPVLLGSFPGDASAPGIGQRPINEIQPHERTTPAGRFVAALGRNATGEDVIWVDYEAAISIHRVRASKAQERRLERLATPSASDNRISYGCINIATGIFDAVLAPLFRKGPHVVYVLPEELAKSKLFPALYAGQGSAHIR